MANHFLRAVIFDLGGTLMYGQRDWEPVIAQADDALTQYLISEGLEINVSTFPHQFRKRLGHYFKQRETDLLETTYTSVLRELLREKGYDSLSDSVLRNALDTLFAITQVNWMLEDDAISTLQRLDENGYRLGIVSNAGDDQDVQQLVRKFGINRSFDFILTSAACSYRKPHPRIFEMALSNWYFHPNEAVMVGDNLDADVAGAQNAGLFGVWISRRSAPRTDDQLRIQPDAGISSLSELPAVLDRLQVE